MHLSIIAHHRQQKILGHMPKYLETIVSEACERAWDVEVCTSHELSSYLLHKIPEAVRLARLRLWQHRFAPSPKRRILATPLGAQIWSWITTMQALRRYPRVASGDHLLILDGDHICHAIGAFGLPLLTHRFTTINFNDFTRRPEGCHLLLTLKARLSPKTFANFLNHEKLTTVITTNPLLEEHKKVLPFRLAEKIRYIDEIGPNWLHPLPLREARKQLNLCQKLKVVLCYGALDANRKGLIDLVAALDHPSMEDVLLLLVGTPTQSTDELLQSLACQHLRTRKRLHLHFGYVSDEVERLVFSSSDVVWLGYRDFYGPSGVLQAARAAGVPVLASKGGAIECMVRRESLGAVVDVSDCQQVRAGFLHLFGSQARTDLASRSPQTNRCSFAKSVCDLVGAGAQQLVH